jgi:hypothetical protein
MNENIFKIGISNVINRQAAIGISLFYSGYQKTFRNRNAFFYNHLYVQFRHLKHYDGKRYEMNGSHQTG